MIVDMAGRTDEPGRLIPDALTAVRQLEALGHDDPIVLAYHPVARVNPYQALLYHGVWSHGIGPLPLYRIRELPDLQATTRAAGVRLALHLHWTSGALWRAETADEARAAVDRYLERLAAFRAGGGDIVWTVHNLLPHDTRWPDFEAELQQGIVDLATVVHVLSEQTPDLAREWFSIPPEKVLHLPHHSYVGAYPDVVSREDARWQLGIGTDEIVYALLGAIKPYKGAERLLDAFDVLCARHPARRRLLVAGLPDQTGAVDAILERCRRHPFVQLYAGSVPPDDMQVFLRASDLVVLPYIRSLNSGVLMLALTFGLPVVAPAIGSIGEILNPAMSRAFDPDRDDALLEALIAADELVTPEARAAAHAVATSLDPARLSEQFARELAGRLRAAAPVAPPAPDAPAAAVAPAGEPGPA